MNSTPLKINWKANSKYVDINTGEELTEEVAKQNYIIKKTIKHAKISNNHGVIEYTHECVKSPQLRLF